MKSIESAAAAVGNQDSRSSSLTHTHTQKKGKFCPRTDSHASDITNAATLHVIQYGLEQQA